MTTIANHANPTLAKPAPLQLDLEVEEIERHEKAGKYGITTTNRRCTCTTTVETPGLR